MPIFYEGLDESKVYQTVSSKNKTIVGQSFVVIWKDNDESFNEELLNLTSQLSDIFNTDNEHKIFIKQSNHHSTILSKYLDNIDIPNNDEGVVIKNSIWRNDQYDIFKKYLLKENLFNPFKLKFNYGIDEKGKSRNQAVIAPTGTIQLNLRNETELPLLRAMLKGIGAQIKKGTIDNDYLFTCTIVLGYFEIIPEREMVDKAILILEKFCNERFTHENLVKKISLVTYNDLSLNTYKEIDCFNI